MFVRSQQEGDRDQEGCCLVSSCLQVQIWRVRIEELFDDHHDCFEELPENVPSQR